MKLGYINYLNCFPFYYHMFHVKPLNGVEVVPAYPSQLNQMLIEGKLDMSPISSAAYAQGQDSLKLLPQFCLSSIGYVRSVILVSKKPIEMLDNCTVGLSHASQTSVVLLKILLQKFYGVLPHYVSSDPFATLGDIDAKLVIGNEAMMHEQEPVPYIYDLGDLWLQKTGYPVVFAVFAVRSDAITRYNDIINDVCASYRTSLDTLNTNPADLIAKARQRYPDIAYDIAHYYTLLKFEFTEKLKEALMQYYAMAWQLQLLPPVSSLQFFGR
ncbi:MAG: menaquinone biosynthesis protein [Spirochaetes bacterium]|nr:menaquinone biosynthesis protein [Spirochaetota bacterium]